MLITVKELLELKDIDELKLVAGSEGIENEIKNTIITDNPDYFDLLVSGDVIITTGYPFFVNKEDIDFQINTIKMLSKANCAALAIKSKKYFEKMPKAILDTAELVGFPIIEIPKEVSLTEVDNIIKKEIGRDNESLLEKSLEVHTKLMKALFGGIDKIVEEIVGLIENPVAIVDLNWKVLAHKTDKKLKEDIKLYNGKKLFFKEHIDKFDFEEMNNKGYLIIKYRISKDENINCFIYPIHDKERMHGYIVIWEISKKFGEIDHFTLEKATEIFAFDMKKTRELENKKNRIRDNFFEDLIAGKLKAVSITTNLAEIYGIDLRKSYACVVVKIGVNLDDEFTMEERTDYKYYIDQVIQSAYRVSENHKSNIMHIYKGNYVILFLPIKKSEDGVERKAFSKTFGEEIYKEVTKKLTDTQITIGIGKDYDNILNLSDSFNEALEVISLSRKILTEEKVLHFDDYTVYNFLESNIPIANLEKFYKTVLSDLVDYDSRNDSELVNILEEYFKNQGNVSLTAKNMYIHRNTLISKLNKISDILNVDLDDSEKILELQLAIKTMKILRIP